MAIVNTSAVAVTAYHGSANARTVVPSTAPDQYWTPIALVDESVSGTNSETGTAGWTLVCPNPDRSTGAKLGKFATLKMIRDPELIMLADVGRWTYVTISAVR